MIRRLSLLSVLALSLVAAHKPAAPVMPMPECGHKCPFVMPMPECGHNCPFVK